MSSRTFTHKSSSKVKKVQCRVDSCKQFIVEQGYSRHLKTAHKKENYKDLRSYGEKQFSWGKKTALNDADLPPELVTQPKEVVVGNEVEEGGDGTDEDDDNDDTMIEALHHQEAGFQLACIGGLLQDPGVSFLCAPKARQIFWTLVVFILKGPQFILGPAVGPQCTLVVYASYAFLINLRLPTPTALPPALN